MPYLSASAVVIHYEEALYQVYAPLPLPLPLWVERYWVRFIRRSFNGNNSAGSAALADICALYECHSTVNCDQVYTGDEGMSRTQKVGEKLSLSVMLGGHEHRVEKDENDHEPVESLTLHQPPYLHPSAQQSSHSGKCR